MNSIKGSKNLVIHSDPIFFYETEDGRGISIDVKINKDDIWLDQKSISQLFDVNIPAVSKHISNIYLENELIPDETISKMEIVQKEGDKRVKRSVKTYNLDVIISIGYRVNSRRATQFRIWATRVLKDYITEGYVIDQKKLQTDAERYKKLSIQLENISKILAKHSLTTDQSKSLLKVISDYSEALKVLGYFDKRDIPMRESSAVQDAKTLEIEKLNKEISELRIKLGTGELFGRDNRHGLASILKSIEQGFGGEEVYPSIEAKAANLLYLIIKNHPFSDGNKRIGSYSFVKYLDLNGLLYRDDGTKRIEENTLVAIALLIAQSDSKDKDLMIDLVVYLIWM